MKKAYLFSIRLWRYDPCHYILVYAETEEQARQIGASQVHYNNGSDVLPDDLICLTYGL